MDINLEAICGDAIIELKKIESNSVDLIVTDPPYNLNKHYGNNYDKFEFDEYLVRAYEKKGGNLMSI